MGICENHLSSDKINREKMVRGKTATTGVSPASGRSREFFVTGRRHASGR